MSSVCEPTIFNSAIFKPAIFETNIIDKSIKVFSLSDIHGDIQSFIISLRDCAKVIKKKDNILFDKEIYDNDMEQLLNLNLNSDEDKYINDLNYEWCGGKTYVVICGDMIDPNRNQTCQKRCGYCKCPCSYYPQIELKILMFINALNRNAINSGGKIVKLLGNHELDNILNIYGYANKYSYSMDHNTNYYKGYDRRKIFNVNNPGFNLLFDGGCGVLIKINNIIFVHGDLTESHETYNELNQFINNTDERDQNKWNKKLNVLQHIHTENSSLFSRARGDDQGADIRIKARENCDVVKEKKFCDDLLLSFRKFIGFDGIIKDNIDDLILVIGHCPQNWSSLFNGRNNTYSKKIGEDDVIEVFGDEIYSGLPVFEKADNRTKIFGITMECLKPNTKLNRVYRIDIGSSRGFDQFDAIPSTVAMENRMLYSKTPQILEINTDGRINIIKSKMRNTRIHLPREQYERAVNRIAELNIHTTPVLDHYKQKYLKYKKKYLTLKNKF